MSQPEPTTEQAFSVRRSYRCIALRKEPGGGLILVGLSTVSKASTFDLLFRVDIDRDGNIHLLDELSTLPLEDQAEIFSSFTAVSRMLERRFRLPLHGLQQADEKVNTFFEEREYILERSRLDHLRSGGDKKGLPSMDLQKGREDVESFKEWKRRQEIWKEKSGQ